MSQGLFAPVAGVPSATSSASAASALHPSVAPVRYASASPFPISSPSSASSAGGGYSSAGGSIGGSSLHRPAPSLGGLGGFGLLGKVHHHHHHHGAKGSKGLPIVLELGDAFIRAGFAGETAPRHVHSTRALIESLRPSVADPETWMDGDADSDESGGAPSSPLTRLPPALLHAASLELSTSRVLLSNPFHRPCYWGPLLRALLRHIYFHVLHANPRDRRLVIVESLGWARGFQAALGAAAAQLDIPGVAFVRGMEAAMYCAMPSVMRPISDASGVSGVVASSFASATLLLDIGWAETRLLPVAHGVALHHLLVVVPLGMWDVHRKLASMLRPLLRMEYAMAGGDVEGSYYLREESRLLDHPALDALLATMSYTQPFGLALDAFKEASLERERAGVLQSPRSKATSLAAAAASAAAAGASSVPGPTRVTLPQPVAPIPSSTAAMDLPQPLPFTLLLHSSPPSTGSWAADVAADSNAGGGQHVDPPMPSSVTLPPETRFEPMETLFEFDRWAGSHAAAARAAEVISIPSEQAVNDLSNLREPSPCEQGLAGTLVDFLISPLGSSSSLGGASLRAALAGNILVQGGGGMVPGLAERIVDECNWMLGGGFVPSRDGRARAERVHQQAAGKMQNKLRVNTCSSALSAHPSSSPAALSSSSGGASTLQLPSLPGPTPSSPSVPPPPLPTPFASNMLSWTGASIMAAADVLGGGGEGLGGGGVPGGTMLAGESPWLNPAELRQFSRGAVVPLGEVIARRDAVEAHKRSAKKQQPSASAGAGGSPSAAAATSATTASAAAAAPVSDQSASGIAAAAAPSSSDAGALTTLNPPPFPDWSSPDSHLALSRARAAAAQAAQAAQASAAAQLSLGLLLPRPSPSHSALLASSPASATAISARPTSAVLVTPPTGPVRPAASE